MQIEKYISITPTPNGALVRFAGQVCLTITKAGQNDPGTDQYFWSVSPIFAKLTYGANAFMDLPQSYASHGTMQEAIADGLTKLDELGAFYGVIDMPEDTYVAAHLSESEEADAEIESMLVESFVVRNAPKAKGQPARKMISAFPVLQRAAEMAKEAGEPMHPKFVKLAHKELSAIASEEVEDLDEISSTLKKSYLSGADKDVDFMKSQPEYKDRTATKDLVASGNKSQSDFRKHLDGKINSRLNGMKRASEEVEDLDEEQLDELSKTTLGSYAKQANAARSHEYDDRKAENRGTGVMKALDKIAGGKNKGGFLKSQAVSARFSASKGGPTANKDREKFEKSVDKRTNEDVQFDESVESDNASRRHRNQRYAEFLSHKTPEKFLRHMDDKTLLHINALAKADSRTPDSLKHAAASRVKALGLKEEFVQYEDAIADALASIKEDCRAQALSMSDSLMEAQDLATALFEDIAEEYLSEVWASGNPEKKSKSYVAKLKTKNTGKQAPADDIKFDHHDKIGVWKRNIGQGEMILRKHKETGKHEIVANNDQFSHVSYPDTEAAGRKYLNLLGTLKEEVLDEATKPLSGDAFWKARDDAHKEEFLKAQRKALGIAEPVKRGRGKPTNIDRDGLKSRAHSNVEAGLRPTAGFDRNEKIHFVRHLKDHPDFAEKHVSQAGRPVGTTKVAAQQKALAKKKQDSAFSMWAGLGKK